jgi:hypothetical protein
MPFGDLREEIPDLHFHQRNLNSPSIPLRNLLLLGSRNPSRKKSPLAQYLCVRSWWCCWELQLSCGACPNPWCKGLACRIQVHHLMERELAFVACSPENMVILCGVDVLCSTTPLQCRRTSRNKEGPMGKHPCLSRVSPAVISILFYCIFTLLYCLYACLPL